MNVPVHLGVLLSGAGRTLQNLMDRIEAGTLGATIDVVISSDPGAQGLERARRRRIPAIAIDRKDFPTSEEFSRAITQTLERYPLDLVILAGFLHLYRFPPRLEGRVLNIHPALLPKFGGKGYYGRRVHEAVLRAGERESGCTVHFANDRYDQGEIVLQRKVPVLAGDTPETLAERVFEAECAAYPEAIKKVADRLPSSRTPSGRSP